MEIPFVVLLQMRSVNSEIQKDVPNCSRTRNQLHRPTGLRWGVKQTATGTNSVRISRIPVSPETNPMKMFRIKVPPQTNPMRVFRITPRKTP
ncbi:hypothetical protein CEXT_791991 [Caerostris extrusa]|uniref:Uncharacterized protein n=1 Tax=Caerostris extrusa TaxID=172846 RepID=A0AAV4VET3_CAEEX|nr:hypothetical protein CEXT_791991 [Caerostris extrusa]